MYKVAFVDDYPDVFESLDELLDCYKDDGEFNDIVLRPFEHFYTLSKSSTHFDAVITDVSAICGISDFTKGVKPLVKYVEDHPGVPIFIRTMLNYSQVKDFIEEVKSYFNEEILIEHMSWEQDYIAFKQLEKSLKGT